MIVSGSALGPAGGVLLVLEELGLVYTHLPDQAGPLLRTGERAFTDALEACVFLAANSPLLPQPQISDFCRELAGLSASGLSLRLPVLQAQLRERPWLFGDDLCLADLLLGLRLLPWLERLPAELQAYVTRLFSRPAALRTRQRGLPTVVIFTRPSLRRQLALCLERLAAQSLNACRMLVCESGLTAETRTLVASWCERLNLSCHDGSGRFGPDLRQLAAAAPGPWLICLQATTLLNAEALKSYLAYLLPSGPKLVFGYGAGGVERTAAGAGQPHAPSQWFPAEPVAYLDYRLQLYTPDQLEAVPELARHPYFYANGSNFALSRQLALSAPELEDPRQTAVALAYAVQATDLGVDFLVDAWAEELLVAPEPAPEVAWRAPLREAVRPARLLASEAGSRALRAALFGHYLPRDARYAELARQPQARIYLKLDHYSLFGHTRLTRQPPDARPAFLILGAPRAGTNALHCALALHPRLAPAIESELHYFDLPERYARGAEWYLGHFVFDGKLAYESSAGYLYAAAAPARIAALLPEVRLIAILREPAARAYSAWNARHRLPPEDARHEPRTFAEVMAAIAAGGAEDCFERGKYIEQLRRYWAIFDRERLLLLNYDELIASPRTLLAKVCAHLGVEPLVLDRLPRFGEAYAAPLSVADRAQLQGWYRPYNRQLREACGLDWDWLD